MSIYCEFPKCRNKKGDNFKETRFCGKHQRSCSVVDPANLSAWLEEKNRASKQEALRLRKRMQPNRYYPVSDLLVDAILRAKEADPHALELNEYDHDVITYILEDRPEINGDLIEACLVEGTEETFEEAGIPEAFEMWETLRHASGSCENPGNPYSRVFMEDSLGARLLAGHVAEEPQYDLSEHMIAPSLIGESAIARGYVADSARVEQAKSDSSSYLYGDTEDYMSTGNSYDDALTAAATGVVWLEDHNLISNYTQSHERGTIEEYQRLARIMAASGMDENFSELTDLLEGTENERDAIRHISQGFQRFIETDDSMELFNGFDGAENYRMSDEVGKEVRRLKMKFAS